MNLLYGIVEYIREAIAFVFLGIATLFAPKLLRNMIFQAIDLNHRVYTEVYEILKKNKVLKPMGSTVKKD